MNKEDIREMIARGPTFIGALIEKDARNEDVLKEFLIGSNLIEDMKEDMMGVILVETVTIALTYLKVMNKEDMIKTAIIGRGIHRYI